MSKSYFSKWWKSCNETFTYGKFLPLLWAQMCQGKIALNNFTLNEDETKSCGLIKNSSKQSLIGILAKICQKNAAIMKK